MITQTALCHLPWFESVFPLAQLKTIFSNVLLVCFLPLLLCCNNNGQTRGLATDQVSTKETPPCNQESLRPVHQHPSAKLITVVNKVSPTKDQFYNLQSPGIHFWIEREKSSVLVTNKHPFTSGEKIRLCSRSNMSGDLAAIQIVSANNRIPLRPTKVPTKNPKEYSVTWGDPYSLGGWIAFKATDRFLVFFSPSGQETNDLYGKNVDEMFSEMDLLEKKGIGGCESVGDNTKGELGTYVVSKGNRKFAFELILGSKNSQPRKSSACTGLKKSANPGR